MTKKEVLILIVEDDYLQFEWLESELNNHFANIKIEIIETEFKFIKKFEKLPKILPDVIIMDIMLSWANHDGNIPEPNLEIREQGYYQAGFRCINILKKNLKTRHIPVIIHSVIDINNLKSTRSLSDSCFFIKKGVDMNELLLLIQSLLPNRLVLKEKIINSLELKPTWFGLSADLKKIWKFLRKKLKNK